MSQISAEFSSQRADSYEIQIRSTNESLPQSELLTILEGLLPVIFKVSGAPRATVAREIVIEDSVEREQRSDEFSVPSLTVPPGDRSAGPDELVEIEVDFADDPLVPFPFRGRSLRSKVAAGTKILSLRGSEKALASMENGPVWSVSRGGNQTHFRSGFALPRISADGCLIEVLSANRFLEMLPLIHWLREICSGTAYEEPPLRACFIFDDPNLHWPCYGFVDYRQIAEYAERENYHVSFATIPLDTWFTHRGTADIFRTHQTRLSLLVHGNNHTRGELAQPYTESERFFLLKQAFHRIERLERQSGLAVSRIMVPPHGACSEEMLAALPICGFEAACISHGSLRAHNKSRPWTKALGFLPSELIRGCPVLPRWGVSGDLKNTILFAAFLKQAIILRGHHQDLKGGPELLDELARFINGLGTVAWLNMTDMARSSYPLEAWQVDGGNDSIRMPSSSSVVTSKPLGAQKTLALPGASTSFIRRLLTEGRDRLL